MTSTSTGIIVDLTIERLLADVTPNVPLPGPKTLNNIYVGLRHGQSTANLDGIISSDGEIGTTSHGLTPLGRFQARCSATSLLEFVSKLAAPGSVSGPDRSRVPDLLFLSSNFTRARETAQECIAALQRTLAFEDEVLHAASKEGENHEEREKEQEQTSGKKQFPLHITPGLRERCFGPLHGTALINYNVVWPIDEVDADNKRFGVESINDVITRVSALIDDMEAKYSGKIIVMTSHADTLQVWFELNCTCFAHFVYLLHLQ